MFEIDQTANHGAKIKVVGVGGSGCNAVNTMIRLGLQGVEFITANTDKQALDASLATTKLAIGQELTKGLGAGANPEIGRKAALEDYAKISEILAGAELRDLRVIFKRRLAADLRIRTRSETFRQLLANCEFRRGKRRIERLL